MEKEQIIRAALTELKREGISLEDLLFYAKHAHETPAEKIEHTLPLSLFRQTSLSGLEIIVKYLRENQKLSVHEIAHLLHRKQTTISCTYRNARAKEPQAFILNPHTDAPLHHMPLSQLCDRTLSVLESIVYFLKKQKLSNHQIAELLAKDDRTIWTVWHRAQIKRGEKSE